jgi:hypothetical protein
LPEIQRIVCKLFKVEPDEILRRTRMGDASEARALFYYIGVRIVVKNRGRAVYHHGGIWSQQGNNTRRTYTVEQSSVE